MRLPTRPLVRALVLASCLSAVAAATHAEAQRCREHDPLRRVHWGDLHVHTSLSMDAYIFDTQLGPADAYRFARGEEVKLAPLDESGAGTRPLKIDRPLDFAAVTDHAQSFGGTRLCTKPGSPVYDSDVCQRYRRPFRPSGIEEGTRDITARVASLQSEAICGPDGARCRDAAVEVWQDTQRAAAQWNDSAPSCSFTTFVAYEHTQTRDMTKVHRNVIFRGARVIERPISVTEEPEALGLWEALDRECIRGTPGCDVLAIPHNPNLSNGQMFVIEYPDGTSKSEQARLARLRARMEPVVEMMQQKGESECRSGMWKVLGADEDCDFEKIRSRDDVPDCKDGKGKGALGNRGCVSRLDYARYALIEGLREADRIGANPYAFGMIAATDIHSGAPGPVLESETSSLIGRPPSVGNNPGGLAAVWAEENSRESLFEALRRREVYGTSGPRMTVRLFGGWDYPDDLCGQPDLVARGYAGGVPMGGDLPARPGETDSAPVFAVSALRDVGSPGSPSTALQRIQIVKGWADADGTFHQKVVDVAGRPDNGASVDLDTCTPRGAGADSLCAVWRDPDFDPKRRAVYYARVLENPSCRYAGWMCRPDAPNRPHNCDDPTVPKVIQERAWTSPIWYAPNGS